MKRIIVLLCIILGATSCGKDNSGTLLRKVCNRWEVSNWVYYYDNSPVYSPEVGIKKFSRDIYSFNPDGSVKITKEDGSINEYTFSFDEESRILRIPKLKLELLVVSVNNQEMIWRTFPKGNYFSEYYLTRK